MRPLKKEVLLFCILCLALCSCAKDKGIKNIGSKGSNIICFGNSLTLGIGASTGNDYPSILAKQIELPVINAGQAGDTTQDALKRLKRDVLNRDPRLVVVEFGGNDFLQGVPKEITLKNLEKIIESIQETKAMVVLVEVRTAIIGDKYLSGFKKIAGQRGAYLIPNVLKGIMTNSNLKSDHIHPNNKGYKIMAARILKALKKCLKL